MTTIKNRYEFVLLFDVKDGNPNGDPDADNTPRTDPETGQGLITDVCLKRKIRNYISLTKNEQPPYDIYIKEKAILNATHDKAYKALGIDTTATKDGKRKGKGDEVERARRWMCENFFDVRTFGAVMSTGTNCGQVRGPVQLTFSRSIDSVVPSEHTITRMAVTTEKDAEKQDGDNRTMGRKHTIPYALYEMRGFISAGFADKTGFSEDDLTLLWEALTKMFDHDHAAARGEMATRGLYVFKHDSHLGNAPSHELLDRIQVELKKGIIASRKFSDYIVSVHDKNLPSGVTLQRVYESPLLSKAA